MTAEVTPSPSSQNSLVGCAARFSWMIVAVAALFFLTIFIAERRTLLGLPADFGYWLVVFAAIVVRWVDVTRLGGRTSEGELATLAHWRRYAVTLLAVSAGVWVLARLVASLGWLT